MTHNPTQPILLPPCGIWRWRAVTTGQHGSNVIVVFSLASFVAHTAKMFSYFQHNKSCCSV